MGNTRRMSVVFAVLISILAPGFVMPAGQSPPTERDMREVPDAIQRAGASFLAAEFVVVGETDCSDPSVCIAKAWLLEVFVSRGDEFKAGDLISVSGAGGSGTRCLGILVPLKRHPSVFGSTFLAARSTDDERKQFAAEVAAAGH
jgi:2-keto-4-pentenoate hydratase